MDAGETLAPEVGTAAACRAMGVARATLYRRRQPTLPSTDERPKRRQPRALTRRTSRGARRVALAAVRRQIAGGRLGGPVGRRGLPLLDSHDVPHSR